MPPHDPAHLKPWLTRRRQTVFQNRWLQVDIDTVELPNGQSYDYTVLRERKHGAAVIALDEQGRLLLQREYRHPVSRVIWQVPGGLIDEGESPLEAARRELLEETGHQARHWRHLGVIWDNPALEEMEIHIFLATGLLAVNQGDHDEAEWIAWSWQPWSWLKQAIREGEIKERVILAAIGLLWSDDLLPPDPSEQASGNP